MRYLGIDYGTRYVGLAIGDDEMRFALPLTIIDTTDYDTLIAEIKKHIASEDVKTLVVGIPASGTPHTEQAETTREFVEKIRTELGLPVETVDESFTSKQAEEMLKQTGNSKDNHSTAAMLILQTYFDRNAH